MDFLFDALKNNNKMNRIFETKPDKCPNCGSEKIAEILYGKPIDSPKLRNELEEGRIILGGCFYADHFPAWKCLDCKTNMFKPFTIPDKYKK